MKKIYTLIILLFIFGICNSQNLIPNGDFELGPDSTSVGWLNRTNNTCSLFGSMAGPDYWVTVNASPDRLLETDITCDWDVDTAQSGKAFIDFVFNESGKAILLTPLQQDSVYKLKYYYSHQTFNGAGSQASRVKFQFNNAGNSILSPYVSIAHQWQYAEIVFAALGNSTEIEISCIVNAVGGVNLDNISLEKLSTITSINNVSNNDPNIILFPCPFTDKLNIQVNNFETFEIILYDVTSRKLLQQTFINSITLNTEQFAKGLYFYEVKNNKGTIKTGKIIKE